MNDIKSVRPSPIAGTWYSANPRELRRTIEMFIENAQNPIFPGEVVALVAPHAGYAYSGGVAGHAFKTILGNSYDCVCVLSPMHRYYPQPLITSGHSAYQTPLGEIPLANEIINQVSSLLKKEIGVELSPVTYDQEHSLEIELPFLQVALESNFRLLPIMMRSQSPRVAKGLGEVLGQVLGKDRCLLVASSDLSHFYSETHANLLDNNFLTALTEFSPDGLFDLEERGVGQACGLAPIAATLWASAALGAKDVTLLKYDTSASTTRDKSSVVGYGAAVITRP